MYTGGHGQKHAIDSLINHSAVAGAVGGNIVVIDPTTLLPIKDSGTSLASIIGGINIVGGWNAATNTPALASGVGTAGNGYIVTTPGTTNLDGITDWNLNDIAWFDGIANVWRQLDNSEVSFAQCMQTYNVSDATGNDATDPRRGTKEFPFKTPNAAISQGVTDGQSVIILKVDGSNGAAYVANIPDNLFVSISGTGAVIELGSIFTFIELGDNSLSAIDNLNVTLIKEKAGITSCQIMIEECLIDDMQDSAGGNPTKTIAYFSNTFSGNAPTLYNRTKTMPLPTGTITDSGGLGVYVIGTNSLGGMKFDDGRIEGLKTSRITSLTDGANKEFVDNSITTHTGLPDAHHTKYTDAEVQTAIGNMLDTPGPIGFHRVLAIQNDPPGGLKIDWFTCYLIGTAPTGDWAASANNITYWHPDGTWHFIPGAPDIGLVFNKADGLFYHWSGGAWVSVDWQSGTDVSDSITTHAGLPNAHHTKYTDTEAQAAILAAALTEGYVLLANAAGKIVGYEDFFYDAATGRLGLGTSSPAEVIHINNANPVVLMSIDDVNKMNIGYNPANDVFRVRMRTDAGAWNNYLNINKETGDMGVGILPTKGKVHVKQTSNNEDSGITVEGTGGGTGRMYHTGTNSVAIQKAGNTNQIELLNNGSVKLSFGRIVARKAISANYTVLATDYIIGVDTSSIAISVTLPTPASVNDGTILEIKDEKGNAGTNNITIVGTIDDVANLVLNGNYDGVSLYTDGTTGWFVY